MQTFNDTFGHSEGDRLLAETSALMADTVREAPTDILARYGGEEFALLLVTTNMNQALCVAERIRTAVAKKKFSLVIKHPGERPTISLGVATFRGKKCCESDLVVMADKALYHSKKNGRNLTSYMEGGNLHVFTGIHELYKEDSAHDQEDA